MGLRKNFFPEPLVIEYFSLTYKAIVWQATFPCKIFLVLKIRLHADQDNFFWNHPYHPPPPPSKVKWSAPLHMIGHISVLQNYCETH